MTGQYYQAPRRLKAWDKESQQTVSVPWRFRRSACLMLGVITTIGTIASLLWFCDFVKRNDDLARQQKFEMDYYRNGAGAEGLYPDRKKLDRKGAGLNATKFAEDALKGSWKRFGFGSGVSSEKPLDLMVEAVQHRGEAGECDVFLSGDFMQDPFVLPSMECGSRVERRLFDVARIFQYDEAYKKVENDLSSFQAKVDMIAQWVDKRKLYAGMKDFPILADAYANTPKFPASSTDNTQFEDGINYDDFIKSDGEKTIQNGSSSIYCGVIDRDIPQRYCDIRNFAIRVSKIPSIPPVNERLDLIPPFGTLSATCTLDENSWFSKGFGGGAAGWMFRGLEIAGPTESLECDAWIEYPLFFVSRWDTTNPYQFHQDALNTFKVFAILGLEPNNLHAVLLDSRSNDGPYIDAWSRVFSGGTEVLDIRQIRDLMQQSLILAGKEVSEPTLCVRRGVWGIHGGISSMSRGGRVVNTNCKEAPLLLAFREFMINRFRSSLTQDGSRIPWWRPLKIPDEYMGQFDRELEFLGKEPASDDLVLRFLSTQSRVFAITYSVRGSTYSRRIGNDNGVIETVKKAARDWAKARRTGSAKHDVFTEVRIVDYATLPFRDQVAISQSTDLFIGAHGASFAHLLYLRKIPLAGVIELQPPERSTGNEQFGNLARKLGHIYDRVLFGTWQGIKFVQQERKFSVYELRRLNNLVHSILDALLESRMNTTVGSSE